jgi:hypothetical protein
MASLKVTRMTAPVETPVAPFAGPVEEIVGGVVSGAAGGGGLEPPFDVTPSRAAHATRRHADRLKEKRVRAAVQANRRVMEDS